MQMICVGIVMRRHTYAWCRYEEANSPTFVVFFFYEPIIITTDPENVKVRAARSYTKTELSAISCFPNFYTMCRVLL